MARLRFLTSKNVTEYIDEDNMPIDWGGKNSYVYKWTPEKDYNNEDSSKIITNGDITDNNNSQDFQKKVG